MAEKKNVVIEDDKKKALVSAMSAIEKQFGKGSVMILGESKAQNVEALPSGCLSLDKAIGIGGLPKGRIIEIYGPESGGKTTMALTNIASCQVHGGTAAFIDAEHALDPQYAKALGVDLDKLIISQPDCGEDALDIAEMLIRSNAVDMLVIDSVAALVPRAELEGEMGDSFVGLQARMLSKAMRKLAGAINKSHCVAIFINQVREKVGIMYGSNETTAGGRALKFFASVRIEVRRVEDIKNGTEKIGVRTKAKIVKNKVAPPFKEAMFEIRYGKGIDQTAGIIDIAIDYSIVEKSGAWLSFNGRQFQGKESLRKAIESENELKSALMDAIDSHDKATNTEESTPEDNAGEP